MITNYSLNESLNSNIDQIKTMFDLQEWNH